MPQEKPHTTTVDKINAVSGAINSLAETFARMNNPAAQPTAQPTAQPAAQPAAQPTAQPTATAQPAPQPTPRPRPMAQTVAQTVAQPIKPAEPELHGMWAVIFSFLKTLIDTLFGRKA
jgi:hypothetical protein